MRRVAVVLLGCVIGGAIGFCIGVSSNGVANRNEVPIIEIAFGVLIGFVLGLAALVATRKQAFDSKYDYYKGPANPESKDYPQFGIADSTATEIRFKKMYAWMMMEFGAISFSLGLVAFLGLTKVNIPIANGIAILIGSALFLGGIFWLKRLPLMLRITKYGVEINRLRTLFLWDDIVAVAVRMPVIRIKGTSSLICFQFSDGWEAKYHVDPNLIKKYIAPLTRSLYKPYDFLISYDELSMHPEKIRSLIEEKRRDARAN